MATKLAYLDGFDIVDGTATVMHVEGTEDNRIDVQLDTTCFYPRGGGQDWDEGTIKEAGTAAVFNVEEVRFDDQGIVHHIGAFIEGELKPGDRVRCQVNLVRRRLNTRLHSAGHVIDLSVDQLKLPWTPGRGAHYPHMSFVEYEGELDADQKDQIHSQIETLANAAIKKGSQNEIRFMLVSEMHTVCRHVPKNIPTHKPARVVIYNHTFGVPCGGTHVKNVQEIGRITISKIKAKKGLIKVSKNPSKI